MGSKKHVNLTKDLRIVDLALQLRDTLIIADIHIGYEEALNKQGIFVPRFQFKDVMQKLEAILSEVKPKRIVINGDLKHEFGIISNQEWRETLKVIELCSRYGEVVIVRGNHDTQLSPIADKRGIKIVDSYQIGDVLFLHGDKIPKRLPRCKTIVIGHEHPAVSIREGMRHETFKCFLKGNWSSGKTLIVQPSFNLVTEGTDILKEGLLSPFLKHNLNEFEVYVVQQGEVFAFGKVKELRKNS